MIDFNCGLHITLATRLDDSEKLTAFLRRVQRLEPGLFTLVKPSRRFDTTRTGYETGSDYHYCRPVRSAEIDPSEYFDPCETDRCSSVNVRKAQQDGYNLIEVRMHHGTLDHLEIVPWISLWMHIFNSSRFEWSGPGECGDVFPERDDYLTEKQAEREDVLSLLDEENIPLGNRLKSFVFEKRRALRPFWAAALPLRVASWDEAGWYD